MQLYFPFKAYSINDYYYNNRAHGKRASAKLWEQKVNKYLQNFDFSKLQSDFDEERHALKVTIIYFYSNFYTKKKKLNKKIFDLSNCEKPLIDLIFNPVNHGPAPYKSPNANIDDCHIIDMDVKKREGADAFQIDIEIVPLP